MTEKNFDLAIIGGGPGGYTAAIRAAQLGMSVGLIEEKFIGGTCTNVGCIPSKALIHSVSHYEESKAGKMYGVSATDVTFNWEQIQKYRNRCVIRLRKGIESLMKKNRIEVINGRGRLISTESIDVDGSNVRAGNIILAMGSHARSLPNLTVDYKKIITSHQALSLKELPRSILIVGAGAIGSEFAYIMSVMGVRVEMVEFLDHAIPMEDEEVSIEFEKALKRRKIMLHTRCSVESVELGESDVTARVKPRDDGDEFQLVADKVLVSVGRGPATENCGLEEIGVPMEKGFIKVDEFNRTGIGNIRAIGDVTGGYMLAHKASAEGIFVTDHIAGIDRDPLVMENIPRTTYTKPEVASVGLNENVAREKYGESVKVGRFPFNASGKAVVEGKSNGFVKLIAVGDDGKLVGAHAIGLNATELIATASTALSLGATAKDFAHVIQAHPTLNEVWHEASHGLMDGSINY